MLPQHTMFQIHAADPQQRQQILEEYAILDDPVENVPSLNNLGVDALKAEKYSDSLDYFQQAVQRMDDDFGTSSELLTAIVRLRSDLETSSSSSWHEMTMNNTGYISLEMFF